MRKLVFIADDDSGQRVTKIATVDDHRRKLVLIQPYESSLYESGLRAPGVPGYVYVFAHASAESIQRITKAKVLADLIRRTNFWNNKPVLIDACNAGAFGEWHRQQAGERVGNLRHGAHHADLELPEGRLRRRSRGLQLAARNSGEVVHSGLLAAGHLADLGAGWGDDRRGPDLAPRHGKARECTGSSGDSAERQG